MDRHFHTFGIGVCSNEKKDDFAFIFQSLVDGLKNFGEVIQVNILISDASSAIRNAFTEVFGAEILLDINIEHKEFLIPLIILKPALFWVPVHFDELCPERTSSK